MPQLFTVAVGLIVMEEQALGMDGRLTSGGLFTFIVLLLVTVPHGLVTERVMVYEPGLVKMNTGLVELSLVPLVKDHDEEVPQLDD